jgi:hypothetical protein
MSVTDVLVVLFAGGTFVLSLLKFVVLLIDKIKW